MTPVIGHYGGYRKTLSFGLTCLVYHATTTFCRRNYNYQNDALGKAVGQMVGAARSARQNIVEGSSRAGTSKETELKLLDVAKASLQELAGDYEAFIVDAGETPWSEHDPKYCKAKSLVFDDFDAKEDLRHEYGKHILAMRKRFAAALENEDPIIAANAVLQNILRKCALRRATRQLPKAMRRSVRNAADRCGRWWRKRARTLAIHFGVARRILTATAHASGTGSDGDGGDIRQPTDDDRGTTFDSRRPTVEGEATFDCQ